MFAWLVFDKRKWQTNASSKLNRADLQHSNFFRIALCTIRGQKGKSSCGWSKLLASITLAAFVIAFLNAGSAPSDEEFSSPPNTYDDNEQQPQQQVPAYGEMQDSNYETTNNLINEEEQIEETIDEMTTELKTVEEEAVEEEQIQLEEEASGVLNSIRVGIGRLFGSTLSDEEVEDVAGEVQEQLLSDATTMLRGKADTIVNREIDGMNNIIQDDEENGMGAQEIAEDVFDQQVEVVEQMRDEIDGATDQVKESMRQHAAEIEKEILEDRLTKKLGKKVKLVIVDDQVQLDSEVDNMLNGLNNLVPNQQPTGQLVPYQQPAYGQQAPAYGQQSSVYGQQAPAYGQPVPPQYPAAPYQPMSGGGYGQQAPQGQLGQPFRPQEPTVVTNNIIDAPVEEPAGEEPQEEVEGAEGLVEEEEVVEENDPW